MVFAFKMNEEVKLRREWLDSKAQSNIRYCFEEMLINTWRYNRQTAEISDDGRDEYLKESYKESDNYLSEAFDRRRDSKLEG